MKHLVLTILALLVAVALFVGWSLSAGPTPGPGGRGAAPGETPVLDAPPGDAAEALTEPPGHPADGATERSIAAAPGATAPPGTRTLRGRVVFPEACRADPELEVFALKSPCQYTDFATAQDDPRPEAERPPWIAALSRNARAATLGRAPVAPDGSFEIAVPGRLREAFLMVRGRHLFLSHTRPVSLRTTGEVVLAAEAGAWVRGTLTWPAGTDGAADVARARLYSPTSSGTSGFGGQPGSFSCVAQVSAGGSFELRAVPTREPFSLTLTSELAAGMRRELGLFEPGATVELALPLDAGTTVAGVVVDSGGRPVAGARVSAWLPGRAFGLDDERARSGDTDESGRFRLAAVPAGRVRLGADHEEYLDSAKRAVDVPDDGSLDDLNLVLESGRTVTGTVAFASGSPAAGVEVRADFDFARVAGPNFMNALRGAEARATTDAKGAFALRGLGAGPFVVEAVHEAPLDGGGDTVPGSAGDTVHWTARAEGVLPGAEGLALVLRPPLGVAGRVVDQDGEPVSVFSVAARRETMGEFTAVTTAYGRDDFESEDGSFFLEGLTAGAWTLEALGDGLIASEPLPVVLPAKGDPVVLAVVRAATVSGEVVGPDGEPVAGARVRLDQGQSGWQMEIDPFPDQPRATADAEGRFVLEGLRPGALALVAEASGFAESNPLALTLEPGQVVDDARLSLTMGGTLTGEVFDRDGERGSGWTVVTFHGTDFTQRFTAADPSGRFRLEHMRPGIWMVIGMDAGIELDVGSEGMDAAAFMNAMRMSQATIAEGQTTHVVIGAPPEDPVRVHGKVTLGDEPYAGVAISFIPEGGKLYEQMENATVDDAGEYALVLDGPGRYVVSIQDTQTVGGQQSSIEFSVDVPQTGEHRLDFEMPLGRMSGRVLDADGRPAPRARLTLTLDGAVRSDSLFGGQYTEITVDGDGTFDVKGLRPGTYRLSAGGASPWSGALQTPYGRVTRGGIALGEDQWLQDLELRLPAPGTIAVRVLDAAGQPVPKATVFVRDEGGRMLEPFSVILSDGSGVCEYTGVAPGEYTVSARVGALTCPESEPVTVRSDAVAETTLRLEEGTILWIKLKDGAGDPTTASVSVTDEEEREMTGMFGMQDLQALYMEGAFSASEHRLGPLPEGRYRVTATNASGSESKLVRLRGEASKQVTLRIGE